MKKRLVFIACFGFLGGCADRNTVTLTYNCEPSGALIVQQQYDNVLGVCPSSYRYQFRDHLFKSVETNVVGVTARWASGATASTSTLVTLHSDKGNKQQITLVRPQDAPGVERDLAAAAEYNAGIPERAFTENHFANYLEIARALPINQLAMAHPSAEITPPKMDPAHPLTTPDQMYSDASKEAGEQGKVEMLLTLNHDGEVKKVALESSSGFDRLDSAAVTAAASWRFLPGTVDGTPTAVKIRFRVVFKPT